jgi:hypothetical protein
MHATANGRNRIGLARICDLWFIRPKGSYQSGIEVCLKLCGLPFDAV